MKTFLWFEADRTVVDPDEVVVARVSDRLAEGGTYIELSSGFFADLKTPFDTVLSALMESARTNGRES